jgi:prepilin-type N-terminal cleavage/methylation domain-containing protein
MKRNIFTGNNAFSLLEVTVVIIILTILASAAIPVLSRSYVEKAGNKTALDISAIQEAARAYYIDNNKWPDNSANQTAIAALQAGNYLPSSWNGVNPFGVKAPNPSLYSYNTSSAGSTFTVYTYVPTTAEPIIQNLLPTNWTSGNTVYSSVSVPGALSVMPAGSIMAWASNNIPAGFLLCDGSIYNISTYPGLANILGSTFGGDGINSFGVPNLQGRAIFGYSVGDGHFGYLGSMGGSTTMIGNGQWSSGHADTANWYNQVKISGGALYDMTGAQTAQGVSTVVLNPYVTLNYIIKT